MLGFTEEERYFTSVAAVVHPAITNIAVQEFLTISVRMKAGWQAFSGPGVYVAISVINNNGIYQNELPTLSI